MKSAYTLKRSALIVSESQDNVTLAVSGRLADSLSLAPRIPLCTTDLRRQTGFAAPMQQVKAEAFHQTE